MIADLFEVVSDAITAFVSALGDAISSVTALFYTPGTSGASGTFTFLGILLLVAVGVGLVYWAVRLIMSLIGRKRA